MGEIFRIILKGLAKPINYYQSDNKLQKGDYVQQYISSFAVLIIQII